MLSTSHHLHTTVFFPPMILFFRNPSCSAGVSLCCSSVWQSKTSFRPCHNVQYVGLTCVFFFSNYETPCLGSANAVGSIGLWLGLSNRVQRHFDAILNLRLRQSWQPVYFLVYTHHICEKSLTFKLTYLVYRYVCTLNTLKWSQNYSLTIWDPTDFVCDATEGPVLSEFLG